MKCSAMCVAAGAAVLFVAGGTARAGSLVLGTSGWTANWSSEDDGRIGLSVDAVTDNAVFIEKSVNFTTNDPVRILFQQSFGQEATPYVVINDETLTNQSGEPWSGFSMTLVGLGGTAQFDNALSQVNQPDGFSIDPFTTAEFSNGDTVLTVGGGSVPSTPADESIWFPGSKSGNLWTIHTAPAPGVVMSFLLVEQPIVTPIPLPAAFWSGMTGLLGLGAVGGMMRKRRMA